MQLGALMALLGCELVCGEMGLDREFVSCFAADMMSDVLAFSTPHALLITGLATVQSVHTADVAECVGILLVSGKRPAPDALRLGLVTHMPILSTPHSMYESCGVLYRHGLQPAHGRVHHAGQE
jgi:hypothetical protein